MKKWLVLNKKADFKGIGERFQIDQVTARIIRNREITEEEDIRLYLQGGMKDLHNPHLLKDGDKLVEILEQKVKEGKSIRIIGDYDIDGVMATYILMTGLEQCGGKVSTQIPDRIHDGYGLNLNLIKKAYEDGIDTIVTCDNGIAAIEEIAYAKSLGMTVLVTDHHAIPYEVKDGRHIYKTSQADAIVNPHQSECRYPYKELCGAAVAWKAICLLHDKFNIDLIKTEELLEYVAFATIGDVMPLTGENRILVKEGLQRLHSTRNIGMRALIAQCQLQPENITSGRIGFRLGPCINASGRLDTAKRSLELFFQTEPDKAVCIANELVELNNERKLLTDEGVESAIAYYESHGCKKDKVIVIYLPQVHESVAGIIAGRIREKYYKPVFILTNGEDGLKGSGRSIPEYSMYEEMCKCQQLFTKFGGHPMAAGLSLPKENLGMFRQSINELCSLTQDDLTEKIYIDVPMPLEYVTMDLVRELSVLEPFGKDNESPVFADRNIGIRRLRVVGQNQNVLRLDMVTQNGMPASGVYFGDIEEFKTYIAEKYGVKQLEAALTGKPNQIRLSIIYNPEINSYRGMDSLQFVVQYYQ